MPNNSPQSLPESIVDITNWQQWPNNQWAFHHVNQIIPTIEVENDQEHHFTFDCASENLKDQLFNELISKTETDGILVLHKGRIVHEEYFHGNTADTHHILMSTSKAVIGLLAEILSHKGIIDLDKTVSEYITELNSSIYANKSLRLILDMRAGLALDAEQEEKYANATNWQPVIPGTKRTGLHEFYLGFDELNVPVDSNFHYISANTDLLGWVIERATGQPINRLLSQFIWKPIGAKHSAYLTVDINGSPRCTGGLCATLRDFALIGQSLLGQEPPLGPLLQEIATSGDHEAWREGEWGKAFAEISPDMSYRSGWYVIHSQPQLIFAMGIFGQNLFIDPVNDIVIAKFSSWREQLDYKAISLTHQLADRARILLTVCPRCI